MLVSGPWNSFQDTRFRNFATNAHLSPYVCYVLAFEICGMHQMCHNPVLEVVNRRSITELCAGYDRVIQMLSRLSHSLNR